MEWGEGEGEGEGSEIERVACRVQSEELSRLSETTFFPYECTHQIVIEEQVRLLGMRRRGTNSSIILAHSSLTTGARPSESARLNLNEPTNCTAGRKWLRLAHCRRWPINSRHNLEIPLVRLIVFRVTD